MTSSIAKWICFLAALTWNGELIGGESADVENEYCVIPSLVSTDVRPAVILLDNRRNLSLVTVSDIWADVAYRGLDVVISSKLAREFSANAPDKAATLSWQWMNEPKLTAADVEGKTLPLQRLLVMGAEACRHSARVDLHYEPLNPVALCYRRPKSGERVVVTLVEQSRAETEAAARRVAAKLINDMSIIPRDYSKADLSTLWARAFDSISRVKVIRYDAGSNVLVVKACALCMQDFLGVWDTVSP